ncbi:unnamed protein product, partial [Ectocarpus fasciculatus]
MRFTCSIVTSIFVGVMSVAWLLLVAFLQVSSQIGNAHLLTPAPASEKCFKSEGAMLVCLAKAATPATIAAATVAASSPGAEKEIALQEARTEMLFNSGGSPMTSRPVQFHDVTTPSAPTRHAKAHCHPAAHDAIDMWDGQWGAIMGELALHAKEEEISPGALILEGLKKIAAGIYQGITGKV